MVYIAVATLPAAYDRLPVFCHPNQLALLPRRRLQHGDLGLRLFDELVE
jgi:hypothetical protein